MYLKESILGVKLSKLINRQQWLTNPGIYIYIENEDLFHRVELFFISSFPPCLTFLPSPVPGNSHVAWGKYPPTSALAQVVTINNNQIMTLYQSFSLCVWSYLQYHPKDPWVIGYRIGIQIHFAMGQLWRDDVKTMPRWVSKELWNSKEDICFSDSTRSIENGIQNM